MQLLYLEIRQYYCLAVYKYLVEEDGLADVSPVLIEPFSEQKEDHEEDDEGEPARPREAQIDDPGHAECEDHPKQRKAPVKNLERDLAYGSYCILGSRKNCYLGNLECGSKVGSGRPVQAEAGRVDAKVREEEEDGAELGYLVQRLYEEEAGHQECGRDHRAVRVAALRLGIHHPAIQIDLLMI